MIGLKLSFFTILSILMGLDLTNNRTIAETLKIMLILTYTAQFQYSNMFLLFYY